MDIDLARAFLEIARSGSFVAVVERLRLTQTAVTTRIQNLERQLGCRLFMRNRAGARLTAGGKHFLGYTSQLVRTWDATRRDLPLPDGFRDLLNLGDKVSLCNPLLLNWIRRLHGAVPGHTMRVGIGQDADLFEQLEQGTLDAALVYQPEYWPELQVEQLLKGRLVMVRSVVFAEPYLYVDWGPDFRSQHDATLPDWARAALACSLGLLALRYIMQNGGSGYFRTQVVSSCLDGGTLQRTEQAPELTYPTYLVYSHERLSPTLRHTSQLLHEVIREDSSWSQRWNYVIWSAWPRCYNQLRQNATIRSV